MEGPDGLLAGGGGAFGVVVAAVDVVPTALSVGSFFGCGAPDAGLQAASITRVAVLQARWPIERAVDVIRAKVACRRQPASAEQDRDRSISDCLIEVVPGP